MYPHSTAVLAVLALATTADDHGLETRIDPRREDHQDSNLRHEYYPWLLDLQSCVLSHSDDVVVLQQDMLRKQVKYIDIGHSLVQPKEEVEKL